MKLLITLMFVTFVCLEVSANNSESNEAKGSTSIANACTSCHNSIVSLKGRGVDVIIKQTEAIRSKNKPHPSTGVIELSDEDIVAIAAILDKS